MVWCGNVSLQRSFDLEITLVIESFDKTCILNQVPLRFFDKEKLFPNLIFNIVTDVSRRLYFIHSNPL